MLSSLILRATTTTASWRSLRIYTDYEADGKGRLNVTWREVINHTALKRRNHPHHRTHIDTPSFLDYNMPLLDVIFPTLGPDKRNSKNMHFITVVYCNWWNHNRHWLIKCMYLDNSKIRQTDLFAHDSVTPKLHCAMISSQQCLIPWKRKK